MTARRNNPWDRGCPRPLFRMFLQSPSLLHVPGIRCPRNTSRIALAEARKNGAQLPLTALVDQFYGEVEKLGGKRWDTSSLIARFDRNFSEGG